MLLFIFYTKLNKLVVRLRMLYRVQIRALLRRPVFEIYKKLGLTTVSRETLVEQAKKYRLLRFSYKELVIADEPKTIEKIPAFQSKLSPFIINIEQPFVCEINNSCLAGPAAVGFDEDRNIILETTTPFHCHKNHLEGSVSIRALVRKSLTYNAPQIDVACSLLNAWSQNYWHWIIDCLTRLEGIEFYQQQTGIKPKLIIDAAPTSWQIDSLKLLGYQSQDCIQWNKSKLKVKKLVVSSFRRHYDKVYSVESPSASRWLRAQMLSNLPKDENLKLFSPRIFISRRKAEGRRIINENDVISTLANFGFVTYVLEDMNFTDEVRLFAQAEVVVAPHGAGLTNIIFAQNLTVVELFGLSVSPCFANLARGLGFQYAYLQCQSPHTAFRDHDSDMVVDTIQLEKLLVQMLTSS